MKRAAILVLMILAICLAALWMSPHKATAPIDVVIDHEPFCAQHIARNGSQIHMDGVERGVCTNRNVIRSQ